MLNLKAKYSKKLMRIVHDNLFPEFRSPKLRLRVSMVYTVKYKNKNFKIFLMKRKKLSRYCYKFLCNFNDFETHSKWLFSLIIVVKVPLITAKNHHC